MLLAALAAVEIQLEVDSREVFRSPPSVGAFLRVLGELLLPAPRGAYRVHLSMFDSAFLPDVPTERFFSLALKGQIRVAREWARLYKAPSGETST